MLAAAFPLGNWKNFNEMEDSISLEELIHLLDASREKENRFRKFYAAFKGVDLENQTNEEEVSDFAKTRMAADAAMAGMSEEQYVFTMIGIDVDIDEDIYDEEEVN